MLRRRPTHHLGDRMHQARRAGLDQVIREAEVPDSQLSRARVAPADSPANGRRATCRGTPHLEGGLGERRNVSNWRQVLICNLDSKPIDFGVDDPVTSTITGGDQSPLSVRCRVVSRVIARVAATIAGRFERQGRLSIVDSLPGSRWDCERALVGPEQTQSGSVGCLMCVDPQLAPEPGWEGLFQCAEFIVESHRAVLGRCRPVLGHLNLANMTM